jgi:3',5'-cyclic AMP phosphodiesterase CpdA
MILATFLHLSDLHIGIPDAKGDAHVSQIWALHHRFDGLLGHSYRSLVSVERIYKQLKKQERAKLVVTGDLTTKGCPDEFRLASEYIGRSAEFVARRKLGLHYKKWQEYTIPGNHDQWPGLPIIWGPPRNVFYRVFPNRPLIGRPSRLMNDHSLRFIGVDTDADNSPFGTNRFFARGSFASQLDDLEAHLPPPEQKEIRVLLLHHTITHLDFLSGIDRKSKNKLEIFLLRNNISVLLSGHTHEPNITLLPIKHLNRKSTVLEARCGTSTQRSITPYRWARNAKRTYPNSVIVHRLFLREQEIYWCAQALMETTFGFEEDQQCSEELRVYPR